MDIIGIPNKPWANGGVPLPLCEWIAYGIRSIDRAAGMVDNLLIGIHYSTDRQLSALSRKVDRRLTYIMADVIAACEWRVDDG